MNSIQSIGIANNYNVNFGHFTSRNIQNSSEILTKSGINPEQVVKQFVDKIEKNILPTTSEIDNIVAIANSKIYEQSIIDKANKLLPTVYRCRNEYRELARQLGLRTHALLN